MARDQGVSTHTRNAASLLDVLRPLLARELAGIAAIEAALHREKRPDYVVLFQDAKTAKQANVEQMATVIRMQGDVPPEHAGLRGLMLRTETAVVENVAGLTATLRLLRAGERDLIARYARAIEEVTGLATHALTKARSRAVIHDAILSAHIAKLSKDKDEASALPQPLNEYFAHGDAKACMRCLFDRPGSHSALERVDPHPYTYVCAACHDDALTEFPLDLDADRWPRATRDARVMQHALGRPSKLNAIRTVLHRLSGQPEDPVSADAPKPLADPGAPPSPDPHDVGTVVTVDPGDSADAPYVADLFDYRSVRRSW